MKATPIERCIAWAVHLLTASGILLGALALLAISGGNGRAALLLLVAAFVVDGIDGPLARRVRVSDVLPDIDGETLDLVVDYVTYVFVPVAFIYRFELLPNGLVALGCALVLLSSLFLFSNRNMKSGDMFFVGFPSIWNLVILYMYVLKSSVVVNALIVFVFAGLTFVPIKTVHPMRVQMFRPLTIAVSGVWLLLTVSLLWLDPDRSPLLEWIWVGAGFYFVVVSGLRTFWGSQTDA